MAAEPLYLLRDEISVQLFATNRTLSGQAGWCSGVKSKSFIDDCIQHRQVLYLLECQRAVGVLEQLLAKPFLPIMISRQFPEKESQRCACRVCHQLSSDPLSRCRGPRLPVPAKMRLPTSSDISLSPSRTSVLSLFAERIFVRRSLRPDTRPYCSTYVWKAFSPYCHVFSAQSLVYLPRHLHSPISASHQENGEQNAREPTPALLPAKGCSTADLRE